MTLFGWAVRLLCLWVFLGLYPTWVFLRQVRHGEHPELLKNPDIEALDEPGPFLIMLVIMSTVWPAMVCMLVRGWKLDK